MENIKTRILKFIETLPYGQDKFEKKCALSRGYVNKLGDNMTIKTQAKIQNEFPELNMNWILTGEGVMLKSDEVVKNADNTELVIALILDEIAGIKANIKGSLYQDEKDVLLKRIEQLDKLR